ncbi:MAG TPA: amidohydrolase family protein, partial [Candidatus Eremiobacteraceae bacterium]|nr:amidohydrolase family protein [Candidatus Eremiobacteraceae bacterium]
MLTRYRTPAYIAFRKRQSAKALEQIPIAYRDGVQFLAGTDCLIPYVFPGFSVHDEIALFTQAGLTPLQALQTATLNPARFLRIANSEGTVETGKAANLVLLDANPLQDIHNTTRIFAVVVRGKLLDRKALDALLQQAADAAAKVN